MRAWANLRADALPTVMRAKRACRSSAVRVTMYFFKPVLLKRLSPQENQSHSNPQVVSGRLLGAAVDGGGDRLGAVPLGVSVEDLAATEGEGLEGAEPDLERLPLVFGQWADEG